MRRRRTRQRERGPEYKGNAALIKSKQTEELDVHTLEEVAELLQTSKEDLAWMPFGPAGIMFMSKAKQLDDDEPINSNATMIAKKMMHAGMKLGVRGDAVIFRQQPPWGRMQGDLRGLN